MMDFGVAVPVIASFAVSAAAGPVIIPVLRKLKVGQTVRDDGPQTHLKKNGTPTMGGLIFLFSVIVTSLFYIKDYPKILPILFVTVGFGVVGFLDDYIKVVLKRSEGLTPGQKMAGQIVVTCIFAWYMVSYSDVGLDMLIPFGGGACLDLGGFVASTAYMLKLPLFILIVGLIYVVEVLSVIIQVTYFKATHGKRFFKMAPIHHHFEKCGWSETRVVAVFSIVTALCCLVALAAV